MSFMANLKVATKLTASACFGILMLIALVVNQYVSSGVIADATAVVEREQTIFDGISGGQLALAKIRNLANQMEEDTTQEEMRKHFSGLAETVREAVNGLETPIRIAMKPDVLIDIRDGLLAYQNAIEAYIAISGDANAVFPQDETNTVSARVDDAIKGSISNAKKYTAEAKQTLAKALATSNMVTMLLCAFVMTGLIASSVFLMFSIGRPVRLMTSSMLKLAEGDTSVALAYTDRSDEIGAMAYALEVFRQGAIARRQMEQDAEAMRRQAEENRIAVQERAEAEAAERMTRATSSLASGLRRLAAGDLSFQLTEALSSEFEQLRQDFNTSVLQLAHTMTSVSSSVGSITNGSHEISTGASDLSKRTEQQAAVLEETAAALDQITANVTSSSKRAEEARKVATEANQSATRSGEVVGQAVNAMSRIEESARQISSIIGVIDEIAFQTNLLALNAGVEAARAGEAGKGFAVVAQEVRELAQRSASAAKEIKGLIQTSTSEVANGVKLVSDTGQALQSIGAFIVAINQHMDAIATSSREQSVGLAEVNTAVNQMDQTTQQNAAMVEQSSAAAASLAGEAGALRQLISRFDLGHSAGPAQPSHAQALRQTAAHMARPAASGAPAPRRAAGGAAAVAQEWSEF